MTLQIVSRNEEEMPVQVVPCVHPFSQQHGNSGEGRVGVVLMSTKMQPKLTSTHLAPWVVEEEGPASYLEELCVLCLGWEAALGLCDLGQALTSLYFIPGREDSRRGSAWETASSQMR